MSRSRRALARSTAVFLCFGQAVLLLFAVAPRMVWCHKPSGKAVIELQAAPGECRCNECSLCREHDADRSGGVPSRMPSLHAAHCRHDEIRSDAGRSTGISPGMSGALAAAPALVPPAPKGPAASTAAPAHAAFSPDMDSGPPGLALRC